MEIKIKNWNLTLQSLSIAHKDNLKNRPTLTFKLLIYTIQEH